MKKRTIKKILERRKKQPEKDEVLIGKIVGAHGIKGEVKVKPETEIFERQLKETRKLTGYRGVSKKTFTVDTVKPYKNLFIIKFKEITDRNSAETAINTSLFIKKNELIPLEEDEFFFEDLINSIVETEDGTKVGKVKEILEMPASHILVVEKENGKEALIPFINQFIKEIDKEAKKIVITPIEGLV
ncbi:ribosome maturation factor RimM [Desulfurobacterium atlanticum]|uniref:Ribosome maturation factor RimM n=1 Tax=Desulfurobacterium atlanticum TaxID=240169 RepID=A0A239A9T9_9BACT|nr:ribosome maturation factor RimM [Desulfurobacterium atlanticum]SNR92279.1 16S rRNA processing protein RimM [Desulfurobacterium atlanticum]